MAVEASLVGVSVPSNDRACNSASDGLQPKLRSDHDLDFRDAAFPEQAGSGQRIAHYLAKRGCRSVVVIHSVNQNGSDKMKSLLKQAHVAPFGTFEIEE